VPSSVNPRTPRSKRCDSEAGAWKLLVVGVSRRDTLASAETTGSNTPDAAPMPKPDLW
jgi:hypothetical protein